MQSRLDPEDLFTKQERIGKGSFGEVYKGIDRRTQKTIAIKIINLEEAEDEIEDIQQEITVLSQCDSCYITKYIGSYIKASLSRFINCRATLCCGVVCVCPSVRPSRSCVVSKRLNLSSNFFDLLVVPPLSTRNIMTKGVSLNRDVKCRYGVKKIAIFDRYLALSLKRYQIRPQLLWNPNRNSCAIYRMV